MKHLLLLGVLTLVRLVCLGQAIETHVGMLPLQHSASKQVSAPPEIVLRTGPPGHIEGLVFNSKGTLLAGTSFDGTVIIWNTQTFDEVLRFHPQLVPLQIAFGQGDHTLLAGDLAGISEYTLAKTPVRRQLLPGAASAFTVSVDQQLIAYMAQDRSIMIYSFQTKMSTMVAPPYQGNDPGDMPIVFSPDRSYLAVGRDSRSVSVYSIKGSSPAPIGAPITIDFPVRILSFNRENALCVVASRFGDNSIDPYNLRYVCVDIKNSNRRTEATVRLDFPALNVQFSSDSSTLLLTGRWSLLPWDDSIPALPGGISIVTPPTDPWLPRGFFDTPPLWSISSNGRLMAEGKDDGSIRLWRAKTRSGETLPSGRVLPVTGIALGCADSILSIAHQDRSVAVWSVIKGERVIDLHSMDGRVALAKTERRLAFVSRDNTIVTMDPLSQAQDTLPLKIKGKAEHLHFVDDDSKLLWLDFADSEHSSLVIWDRKSSGSPQTLCHMDKSSGFQIAVSSSGDRVAATCFSGVGVPPQEIRRTGLYVWSLPNLTPRIFQHAVSPVFSPDGRYLVVGDGITVIDLLTGEQFILEASLTDKMRSGQIPPNTNPFANNPTYTAIAFSSDGKSLIAGIGLGQSSLHVWPDWKQRPATHKVAQGDFGSVSALMVDDKQHLWVGSDDGTVTILRERNMESLLKILSIENAGWVAVSPYGPFDGRADAINWIGWRRRSGDRIVTADVYFNSFYTPGILGGVVKNTYSRPTVETIGDLLDLPGLDYLLNARLATLERRGQEFGLCLTESPSTDLLSHATLTYKGRVDDSEVKDFVLTDEFDCKYFRALPGDPAAYELNARESRARGGMQQINQEPTGKAPQAEMQGVTVHLQTITFNHYIGWFDLNYPRKDAADLTTYITKEAFPASATGWPKICVHKPIDDVADLSLIRDRLREIGLTSQPQDIVIVFLSGHGTVLPGQQMFFFVPNSVTADTDTAVRSGSLNSAMVADIVRDIVAERVLLIIDSCQSGGVLDSLIKVADSRVRVEGTESTQRAGIAVIAAATPFEEAVEQSNIGNGFFMKALLEALRTDSASIRDLQRNLTQHLNQVQQTPVVALSGQDFLLRWKPDPSAVQATH